MDKNQQIKATRESLLILKRVLDRWFPEKPSDIGWDTSKVRD